MLRVSGPFSGRFGGEVWRGAVRQSVLLVMVLVVALLGGAVVRVIAEAAVPGRERINVTGSTTVGPIAKAFAEYYMGEHPDVNVTVEESGSGDGVRSLLHAGCQVATMSRFLKQEEFATAVDQGICPVPHVVAMDAVAVIVHPSNPIRSLSVAQLRGVFSGRVDNWKELGGPDLPVVRVCRDASSGTHETFEELVLGGARLTADAERVVSNQSAHQRVEARPGAIGYVGLAFLDKSVKSLAVDDVLPTRNTVTSGRYPLARPLYFFTDGFPSVGTHLHSFVSLHLTRDGHNIIHSIGFVPVTEYADADVKR